MTSKQKPPRLRRFLSFTGCGSATGEGRAGTRSRTLTLAIFGERTRGSLRVFLTWPLALDPQEKRAGDVDRAERSGKDAECHDPRERSNDLTREEEQRECGGKGRGVREDGTRQRLVDGAVHDFVQRLAPLLLQVLAYTVEDDDRVVE